MLRVGRLLARHVYSLAKITGRLRDRNAQSPDQPDSRKPEPALLEQTRLGYDTSDTSPGCRLFDRAQASMRSPLTTCGDLSASATKAEVSS